MGLLTSTYDSPLAELTNKYGQTVLLKGRGKSKPSFEYSETGMMGDIFELGTHELLNSMIEAMLHEHELARCCTSALHQATRRLLDGDQKASSDVVYQSRHYTALLHNHIAMEDKFVFPYIAQLIPPDKKTGIDHLIEVDSQADSENGNLGKYLSLVENLEKQTLITPQG